MANIDFGKMVSAEAKAAEVTAQLKTTFEVAVQRHLDETAKGRGYDSVMTAVSYADEPAVERFQKDGQAFRSWRSLVWQYAYEQLEAVEQGTRAAPALADFLAELPTLEATDAA